MKAFGCGSAMDRLASMLMVLGVATLVAACGSSSSTTAMMEPPDDTDVGEPVLELGEWNTLRAGSLDISDANQILRAYYDAGGVGRIVPAAPVQPVVTGTATWSGMWSGRIELNPDPLAAVGLGAYGVNADDLAHLGGGARLTAFLGDDGVMAELTYQDLGLNDIGLSDLTSDRVPVTDGRFRPERMYSISFEAETANPFDPSAPTTTTATTVTGDFAGEGAFGGTDAAGVVGYIGGRIDIDYGRGATYLGTLQSVFYGNRGDN